MRQKSPPQLIILGSNITALGVVRSAYCSGISSLVVDTVPGLATTTRLTESFVLSGMSDTEVLNAILQQSHSEDTHLIATGDEWLRFILRHRDQLEAVFQIIQPKNEVLAICLDKRQFAEWCVEFRLPTPATITVSSAREVAGFPLPALLRPASQVSLSRHLDLPKARQIDTSDELKRWLERFAALGVEVVISESLLGRPLAQFSVPFAHRGDQTLSYVAQKLRPTPAKCSVGTYVQTDDDAAIRSLAMRVVELLNFEGIGEIEILRDLSTNRDYLIEVNARPWLQFSMTNALGLGFLDLWLKPHVQQQNCLAPRTVRWLDFTADLYTVFSRSEGMMAAGEITWWEYARSILATNSFAKWHPWDPMPFLKATSNFLKVRRSRLRLLKGM